MFKTILLLLLLPIASFSAFSQSTGDKMNLNTGEYIMDMGGGDSMNLATGEYTMDIGGGDKMNLDTGEIIIDLNDDGADW
ncbi:hypothetical protein ACFL00_02075 [Pseudomonadota bacterium]